MTESLPEEPSAPRRRSWGGVDLAALWELSRPVLEKQVTVIERAVVAGIEGMLPMSRQLDAGSEAHKLAGSLGTFGFQDASRMARELELALRSTDRVEPARALELSGLVVSLGAELARPLPAARPGVAGGRPEGAPTILVVDVDPDWTRRTVEAIVAGGASAQSASDLDGAIDVIAAGSPDIVVLDTRVGSPDDVASFLSAIADHRPPVATVVLTSPGQPGERVQATDVGASVVLERPAPPDAVVRSIGRLMASAKRSSTVLVVDDDPMFLLITTELLQSVGLSVETLSDASKLWPALERVDPDLLLLDNQMPGVNGVSLCRALRADERWAWLPVVFVTGSRAPDVVRDMFAAGADDYVSKPVTPDEFIARVVNRIERTRSRSDRADTDPTTGLPGARAFVKDANRLIALAHREGTAVALAVVEVDPPHGAALASLARLIRQAAAEEDAVGAWSGGRLAALFYGTSAMDAQARTVQVLRSARAADPFGPKASGGVAAYPVDGADLQALSAAAEAALGRARTAAGEAAYRHEAPGGGRVELVDVLLVDDDEALGALVVHALSSRGWSVRWVQDGSRAVELLDDPGFRARAVLLDVGLPGLDGIAVLRHVSTSPRLVATRVVMLTIRSNESEVLEALDLGAFDHVAKPFSLAVLVHRVRRAIEAAR